MKIKERPGEKLVHYIIVIIVIAVSLTCLIPFLNTMSLSFSNKSRAAAGEVFLLPKGFTFASYKMLLKDTGFFTAFGVSVLRVIVGGGLNFILTVLMAYPLSKSPKLFKGRNVYMWILVFCMMFSAGLIPLYLTVSRLGLIDSFWSLVLPGAVPIYNVILLMNYFRNIRPGMEEAAIMDGASHISCRSVFPGTGGAGLPVPPPPAPPWAGQHKYNGKQNKEYHLHNSLWHLPKTDCPVFRPFLWSGAPQICSLLFLPFSSQWFPGAPTHQCLYTFSILFPINSYAYFMKKGLGTCLCLSGFLSLYSLLPS